MAHRTPHRHGPGRSVAVGFATLVALLAALPLAAAPAAAASATPAQSPFPLPCSVITKTDSVAIFYYLQIIGGPENLCPGQLFFGDDVYIQFTNTGGNRTVEVTSAQQMTPVAYFNESFTVGAGTTSIFELTLPSTLRAVNAVVCVDGGCLAFPHQTPLTLLPSGVLTIGGIDLLLFAMCILLGFALIPTILLARYLTHRALWSPRSFAWLWGPHIVVGFLLLLAVDYMAFDVIFGGWGVFLFPTVLVVIIFYEALPWFNVVDPSLVLQMDPRAGHRLDVKYDVLLIAEVDVQEGTKHVAILPGWTQWLARIRGFFPVVSSPGSWESAQGPPAELKLVAERLQVLRASFRAKPGREDPMESFRAVANRKLKKRYKFRWVYFVDSDNYLEIVAPYISWSRPYEVTVTTTGADGQPVVTTEVRRRLSLPHFVAPPESVMGLSGIHIVDTLAQSLGYVKAERANRRLHVVRRQNALLKATVLDQADDLAATQMDELLRTLHRAEGRDVLTDAEAQEETLREPPKSIPSHVPRGTETEPSPVPPRASPTRAQPSRGGAS